MLIIQNDVLIEHDFITITKQEISDEVILANSVSPVKGNKTISNIINISERPYILEEFTTQNFKWEPYEEKILLINENQVPNHVNEIKEIIQVEHLNKEEKENIFELCSEYADIFFLNGDKLSATDIVIHDIKTSQNIKPINIRPYRLPWAFQEEIEIQIVEMKQNNIIRNSTSPFNYPLVVVTKKSLNNEGKLKLRVCVDFRKLNGITENEAYGLPNLVEILESLGSSKYFSTPRSCQWVSSNNDKSRRYS